MDLGDGSAACHYVRPDGSGPDIRREPEAAATGPQTAPAPRRSPTA